MCLSTPRGYIISITLYFHRSHVLSRGCPCDWSLVPSQGVPSARQRGTPVPGKGYPSPMEAHTPVTGRGYPSSRQGYPSPRQGDTPVLGYSQPRTRIPPAGQDRTELGYAPLPTRQDWANPPPPTPRQSEYLLRGRHVNAANSK